MPPIPPSRQLYDRLSQDPRYKGIGNSYESFVSYFSQPTNAQKLYGTLSKDTRYKGVGKDFNSFSTYFQLGHTGNNDNPAPAPQQQATVAPPVQTNSNKRIEGEFQTGDIFSDPKDNSPYQIQNGKKVYLRSLDNAASLSAMFPKQKPVSDATHLPQNRTLENDAAIQKFDAGVKDAVTSIAKARLKSQGKAATPKAITEEIDNTKADLKSGKLSVNRGDDGKVTLGTSAGFWDGVVQSVANSVHNLKFAPAIIAAHINGDNKGLADIAEEIAKEKEYIKNHPYKALGNLLSATPVSASDLAVNANTANDEGEKQLSYNSSMGSLGQTTGSAIANLAPLLIPGAGEAEAGTNALLQQLAANTPRMIAGGVQTGLNTMPERFLANYQENKTNGLTPEQAATKAAKDAEIQSIIPAVAGGAFFSGTFGGGAATKGLGEALGHAVKNGANFAGLMGVQAGVEGAVKQAGGYKTDYANEIGEAMKSGFAQTLGMELLPHAVKLPSYVRSQLYNYASENVAKPVLEQQLSGTPDGEQILNHIEAFKKLKESLPANIAMSEETKAAIAGKLLQKAQLKKQIDQLHDYGGAFNDHIAGLEKQMEGIDNDVSQMAKTDKPFLHETDEATGERLHPVKTYDQLKADEKGGIVVPKEYGGVDTKESGEGEDKIFTGHPYTIEKDGALEKKKYFEAEGKTFKDKKKAEDYAQQRLAQHYYENGMHDGLKPIAKETKIKEDEKADNSTNTESNERQPTEEEGSAITGLNQEVQPTEEAKQEVSVNKVERNGSFAHTKGVFKDSDGNLYKSTQEANGSPTNEHSILEKLQKFDNVVKIGDKVNTNEGEAFKMEKLTPLKEGDKITLEDYRKIQDVANELDRQGIFMGEHPDIGLDKEGKVKLYDFSLGREKAEQEHDDPNYDTRNTFKALKKFLNKDDKQVIDYEETAAHNKEFPEFETKEKGYLYNLKYRPFGVGTFPKEGFVHLTEKSKSKDGHYGTMEYSRPLSSAEIKKFELENAGRSENKYTPQVKEVANEPQPVQADTTPTAAVESPLPTETTLPKGQVPESGVQDSAETTGLGDAKAGTPVLEEPKNTDFKLSEEPPVGEPPPVSENNTTEGDGFTRINKAALKEDYSFTKNFESKSDQSVANEAMRKLHERAADNSITPQQQAANEVAAMKHKTGESSEHDIVTATYHLMNLDEQISKVKDDFTEGLLLQQREDALTTLRQLGNNAGRNLRLFSVAYKKVAEGAIETTRRQLRRDLGIEELPKTVKDLEKSNLTAADKKKVRPYVQTIEQLEKDLKDINKKGEATVKDINDKELQEAIKKAYEQGKKEAQSVGSNKKKSDKLRDFAKKIRESDTLDKLGLGKSAAGDAQANGFSFNAKEALAKTIELIADGMDKVEAIAKALKESGAKASTEFNELVDTALTKLSLRDKEEVANDIKALAASEQSTTITKEMVQQNLIYDFVKQHIFSDTPYEQVIKTATEELKQYLPDVNEKTVADAFVKRGEFKPETKQQVQSEMRAKEGDVKRLALSELKLRALEAANDIHEIKNDTKLSAEEKKKAIDARKSTYEKQVDDKIQAIEEKKARIIENAKQAKAEYRKLETERNRQLAKVQALKEKIANYQKGKHPESTKKTTEPDTPEIEALKAQAKEEEKKLNEMESKQRKQLRQSLSEQDEIYSLEQESKRVKAEKTIFANATKSPKKASDALKAARKQMEQAYSEAGIRPEKQNKKDIQIYKEAEDAIKEIEQNSALSDDVKKEHIAQITADRDAQLNLTKQGVLINLKTAIDSHVADLTDRIKTAQADGDTEAAQHLQDVAKDLSDMSQRLKPNGENLKDQIDKADQDITALIKNSKGTPSESELEDLHTAFVADWQKAYDELQRQQLLKQKESQLRAIQRRFNAGSYSQVESTPFDIQRDKVLAEQDAQIKKAYTRLNALSEMAKKDTRSFADRALDVRKQWLIATFSAIEKVAGSAVTKPFIDAGNKQTFGRLTGAITGIKPVELGMVKDTFRQMRNSESAGKFMQQRNNAYVDALVNYEKTKAQHGEDAPQTQAALKAMQTAELKHAASLAYLYINAGSHIDIKQIMLNAATDLDASLAKYNKKYAGEMGKWEKVGYWLESVNRTHGAMKSVSARQALLDGYIENLQYFQKQGEPLDVDTRMKAWDMATLMEYEQGRFSEPTKLSNQVAKLKSHENAWIRRPANFLVPVSKISINIVKQGIDRALPLEVMYRSLGKDAFKGIKLNAADGVEFSNFASKYYNGIKRGFNELPLEQKKYINTLMARGLAGLTQYALVGYLLHSGAIKYGGAYNDNDPFKKKYGQVLGADGLPLGNGEWEFGGHRAPKLLNAIINHSPYSMPASIAADTHWQMVRPDDKGNGAKVIGQVLNETYQRLPFATAVDLIKGTFFGDEYKLERTVANILPSSKGTAELLDSDPQTGEARKVDTQGDTFWEKVGKMVMQNTPGLRNILPTKTTTGSSSGTTGRSTERTTSRSTGRSTGRSH